MKVKIKSVSTIFLCIILLFSFVSCSSETTDNINKETDVSSEKTETTVNAENKTEKETAEIASETGTAEETTTGNRLKTGLDIFLSNKYYIEGYVVNNGEKMQIKLASDDNRLGYRTMIQYSMIETGIILLDNVPYFYIPSEKIYTEINDEFLQKIGLGSSFDVSEFTIDSGTKDEMTDFIQEEIYIEEQTGIRTTCVFDTSKVILYSVGNELTEIEQYDLYGNKGLTIEIDNITSDIPSDMLTLDNYKNTDASRIISVIINA